MKIIKNIMKSLRDGLEIIGKAFPWGFPLY